MGPLESRAVGVRPRVWLIWMDGRTKNQKPGLTPTTGRYRPAWRGPPGHACPLPLIAVSRLLWRLPDVQSAGDGHPQGYRAALVGRSTLDPDRGSEWITGTPRPASRPLCDRPRHGPVRPTDRLTRDSLPGERCASGVRSTIPPTRISLPASPDRQSHPSPSSGSRPIAKKSPFPDSHEPENTEPASRILARPCRIEMYGSFDQVESTRIHGRDRWRRARTRPRRLPRGAARSVSQGSVRAGRCSGAIRTSL